MQEPQKIIRNFGVIAITTALTMATQSASGLPMIMGVANGILGNLASSYIEKAEIRKLSAAIRGTHPSELNHDLQKLLVKSVRWTIKNIQLLYEEQLDGHAPQIKELRTFTKRLQERVAELEAIILKKKDHIYQIIDQPTSKENTLNYFNLQTESFPIIKNDKPFNTFFKDQFQQNLQLCFVELLKKEENRPAYIAYQRAIYEKLDQGVLKVIEQNETVLAKLEKIEEGINIQQSNKNWTAVRQEVGRTDLARLQPAFENLITEHLGALHEKTDLLIDLTKELSNKVDELQGLTIGMNQQLRENWLSKNKVWVFSALGVAGLVIAFLLYNQATADFQMTLSIETDKQLNIHPQFPEITQAKLKVYLPTGTSEKEISTSNAAVFLNLPYSLAAQKVRVELVERYWELAQDSFELKNGTIHLAIRPNGYLGLVEGRVLSRDGKELLNGVTVQIDGDKVITDESGRFQYQVPIEQRRLRYLLRISKEGYQVREEEYLAGSAKEIRLQKE